MGNFTIKIFLFEGYSENAIGDWWKPGFVVFIDLMTKDVHLPFSNSMSLIFNAFTVCSLCSDNKHNKITNFSDKSFKGKSNSRILRESKTISGFHTANCLLFLLGRMT